jgi:alpha-glucosidase (family GH31 glycosyl hydrolase)
VNTRTWAGAPAREGLQRGALRKAQEHQVVEVAEDEAARAWCWSHYLPRVLEGADAWWTDNSERVDGVLKNGLPSRNLFGHLWNKFLYSGMAAAGREGRLVLTRGAWLGAQRYAHSWPGDTGPGTARLKEDLRWQLNCSTSGVPFNSVDLGGFVTYPSNPAKPTHQLSHYLTHSDDNVIRRIANAFLLFTIPRLHGGGQDRMPWQYSDRVRQIYMYFLRLRYRFTPQLWSLALHARETGEPIYRPLFWDYPLDPRVYDVDDELLLGRDLLFAPVTDEGAGEREVYLPDGEWRHAFTGRVYAGGRRIMVNTPLYEPAGLPLFLRRGGFLALGEELTHIAETPETDLSLHLWPSRSEDRHVLRFSAGEQLTILCRPDKAGYSVSLANESSAPRAGSVIIPGRLEGSQATAAPELFGGGPGARFSLQPAGRTTFILPSPGD